MFTWAGLAAFYKLDRGYPPPLTSPTRATNRRQPRQPMTAPCLYFRFQYALIRNNPVKKIWGRILDLAWLKFALAALYNVGQTLGLMCNLKFKSGILSIHKNFLADIKIMGHPDNALRVFMNFPPTLVFQPDVFLVKRHFFLAYVIGKYIHLLNHEFMNIVKKSLFKICLSAWAFKR